MKQPLVKKVLICPDCGAIIKLLGNAGEKYYRCLNCKGFTITKPGIDPAILAELEGDKNETGKD